MTPPRHEVAVGDPHMYVATGRDAHTPNKTDGDTYMLLVTGFDSLRPYWDVSESHMYL